MAKIVSKIKEKAHQLNLKARLLFWKRLSITLLITLLVLIGLVTFRLAADYSIDFNIVKVSKQSPYSKEIKEIIEPLRYNGLKRFLSPEVFIALDFDRKSWTINNMYKFDSEQKIILPEGKYGICADLAIYAKERIEPLLSDSYQIKTVRAKETNFFFSPEASHVVLEIKEKGLFSNIYILDPSFKRYGHISEFEDYIFLEKVGCNYQQIKEDNFNEILPIRGSSPLIIKKNYLLSLTVEDNNGRFGPDNFILSLGANKKHKFAGRYVFAIRNNQGVTEQMENEALAKDILNKKEYQQIKSKMMGMFLRIIENN